MWSGYFGQEFSLPEFLFTLFHESLINLLEGNFRNPNDYLHTGSLKKIPGQEKKWNLGALRGLFRTADVSLVPVSCELLGDSQLSSCPFRHSVKLSLTPHNTAHWAQGDNLGWKRKTKVFQVLHFFSFKTPIWHWLASLFYLIVPMPSKLY